MHKTKLGISVGLMGMIVCFLGLIYGVAWPFLAIVAYILFKEENSWLKRITIKVLLILIFMLLVPEILDCIVYVFDFVNTIADDDILHWPFELDKLIKNIVDFIGNGLIILIGFKALKQGHLSVKPIDDIVSKNV